MKLGDLTLPISDAEGKALALVFTTQLAGRLAELHSQYGSTNCIPMPRVLTDGRLMLCADVLTEIEPGGLLHAMWEAADKGVLSQAVTVLPWAEAVALLPAEPAESLLVSGGAQSPTSGGVVAPGVSPSLGGAVRLK
jgi:hypothetical protein